MYDHGCMTPYTISPIVDSTLEFLFFISSAAFRPPVMESIGNMEQGSVVMQHEGSGAEGKVKTSREG